MDKFLSLLLWVWHQVEIFVCKTGLMICKTKNYHETTRKYLNSIPGQYPKTCSPKPAYPTTKSLSIIEKNK